MKYLNKKSGFTLVEMVISMGIFMLFMTAIFGAYFNIINAQKKTNQNRELVAELRETVQTIAAEAKEKAIDYSCYTPQEDTGEIECINGFSLNEVEEIGLISKDGTQRTIFKKHFDSEKNQYTISSKKQKRSSLESGSWTTEQEESQIHSANLILQDIGFFITPSKDPFISSISTASDSSGQFQPLLNIVINAKRKNDANPIIVQTSISSRIYNSFQ